MGGVGIIAAGILVWALWPSQENLQISFLDIGQGDSIYIRSPSGKDMLIDGGRSSVVLQRLSAVMPWHDRHIDIVLATHPDADHIGGLPDILKRYEVGMLVESGAPTKNAIQGELQRLAKEKHVENVIAKRGMVFDLGAGAEFDVLYPDRDMSKEKDTNSASIVGQMRYGSTTVMLTGDSPKSVETYLVSLDGSKLKSDILKAGHHGSRTSSGEAYVKVVAPEYAIISAGKDNRYGHPHQEVVDVFQRLGVEMLRTDEDGTIRFESDSKKFIRR